MNFLLDERGQDLTEYALLLAFVVIAAAGLLIVNTQSLMGVWASGNQMISTANSVARSGSS